MSDLILYLGMALIGYFVGAGIRKHEEKFSFRGKLSTVAIVVMVTSMGVRMGANDKVISNLGSIGLFSFVITIIIMVCAIVATSMARRAMGLDSKGYLRGQKIDVSQEVMAEAIGDDFSDDTNSLSDEKVKKIDSMTIMIVVAVLCGGIIGYIAAQNWVTDLVTFDERVGLVITVGLCLLLLLVGLDMGIDGSVVSQLKKVGFRVLVIPFAVIVGSLIGALICGLILPISFKEGLAVGSGLGWYSLAPSIIIDYGWVVISAISFLHNVMREMLSFVFIPLVARKIGYIETVALPGAAAMDVCLPMVEKSTRSDIAVFSFVSGLVCSFAVPIMVPIMLNL